MLQKDPSVRSSAEEYLVQQRNRAFPGYFYTFLKLYLQKFATSPILTADDRIARSVSVSNKLHCDALYQLTS